MLEYLKFQDPSPGSLKESKWQKVAVKILRLVLPEANPDFDKVIGNVTTWFIEYDHKDECISRELGFDERGKAIVAVPDDRNYGYWLDSNMTRSDFDDFETQQIDQSTFVDSWNSFEKSSKQ